MVLDSTCSVNLCSENIKSIEIFTCYKVSGPFDRRVDQVDRKCAAFPTGIPCHLQKQLESQNECLTCLTKHQRPIFERFANKLLNAGGAPCAARESPLVTLVLENAALNPPIQACCSVVFVLCVRYHSRSSLITTNYH